MMKFILKHLKFPFALIFTAAAVLTAQSQTVQKLEWQGFSGINNEFLFLIPEGYQIAEDGEMFVGKNSDSLVRINNRRTVTRYVNGVVLMMELYEGNIKKIQSSIAEMYKSDLLKDETIGGFQFKSYSKKFPDFVLEQQHFYSKDALYLMSAAYRSERGEVVENFFKSIRLVDNGKAVAPNLPKDAKKELLNAGLPDIVLEASSEEIVEQPDKKAVIVYRPKPSFKREFGKSNSGTVKLKVLLLANGKVGKVELVAAPNLSLYEGVRNSAEHLVFLPAEKNGKPVTSWQTVDYGFQMTLTGF